MKMKAMLEYLGYTDVRYVNKDVGWCGVGRFIYTCGVCINMDATGMSGRFCFDTEQNARLFLKDWDGKTYPEVGVDGCTAIKAKLPSDILQINDLAEDGYT